MDQEIPHVNSDAKVVLTGGTFNTLANVANLINRARMGGGVLPKPGSDYQPGMVLVQNRSSSARNRFEVLGLGDWIFSPSVNLEEWQNNAAYVGVEPAFPANDGNFCVLLAPAAVNAIVPAVLCGRIRCLVYAASGETGLGFADVKDRDPTCLQALPSGAARIIKRNSGTGSQWAEVLVTTSPGNVSHWGTLGADLTQGASASATLSLAGGATLAITAWDRLLSVGGLVTSGSVGLFKWFPEVRKWYLVEAACP